MNKRPGLGDTVGHPGLVPGETKRKGLEYPQEWTAARICNRPRQTHTFPTHQMQPAKTFLRWEFALAAVAIAVGGASLHWDLEISQRMQELHLPGDINKAIQLSEAFGHSIGPIAIFATLLWIDVANRDKLRSACIFTAICAVLANAFKYMIPRTRPHSVDSSPIEILTSWDTWGIPWTGSWFEEEIRSFPSGHSATAVAFAIGLSHVYPRGKWIFGGVAATACLQRMVSSAHFLSDIMGGVTVALCVSVLFWRSSSTLDEPCQDENSQCIPTSSL